MESLDRASKLATPLGNDRLVSAVLVNTVGVKIQSDTLTVFVKVANSVSSLFSLCHFSHNQRTTAFRHPVSGQISAENMDFILQEQ